MVMQLLTTMQNCNCYYKIINQSPFKSRLTVVSCEAKEEVPCDGLSTNAREYFTRTNLVKIYNAITEEPKTLGFITPVNKGS